MKIDQKEVFQPITIVLETREDVSDLLSELMISHFSKRPLTVKKIVDFLIELRSKGDL